MASLRNLVSPTVHRHSDFFYSRNIVSWISSKTATSLSCPPSLFPLSYGAQRDRNSSAPLLLPASTPPIPLHVTAVRRRPFSSSSALSDRPEVALTSERYPSVRRGAFSRLDEADLAFFRRLLPDGERVVTEVMLLGLKLNYYYHYYR